MSQGELGAIVRRRLHAGAAGALAIGVLAIGLLLSGCSGSPPEPSDPPPTTSATDDAEPTEDPASEPTEEPVPDSTATVEPPAWNPAMDEPTLDGAFAFGEYFMDLYSYTLATGDDAEWRRLSHPDCVFCASVARGVQEGHRETTRVEMVRVHGERLNNEYFSLDYELSEWLDDATEPAQYPASIGVYFIDGGWSTRAIEIHDEDVNGTD